uniref:Uncharacterized protein LOC111108627 n=1 Tax=Crassostrea virginica TaxID=6565 RepID=A0A8B8BA85_CRAVI|nr:uncharacterized protein LOC111108627 [Crassostrea virginica]
MARKFFQRIFFLFALVVIWQCFPLVITQNSTPDTERYQTVSDSLNGNIGTLRHEETTTEVMVTADSSRCPIVIISPQLISTDIGTSARFQAIVETYNGIALESRWLKQGSNKTETIDVTYHRYLGSRNLPFPELVINNVTFDDQLSYELQVRIIGGWCLGNTVQLEVRGVFQFYEPCNHSKECDEWRGLVCSPVHERCVCNSSYYHRNRTCHLRSNLRAIYQSSMITTSNITVWWSHPFLDSDLVQSYNVSLRENFNTSYLQASVDLTTNYTFVSYFPPSYWFVFEIASFVVLNDPIETFFVNSDPVNLFVDLDPPGPIDRNASRFHPQSLYLRWIKPENNTYVDMYRIWIDGYSWYRVSTNSFSRSVDLEPGRNYTVRITAYARYWSFRKASETTIYQIQTMRIPKVTIQSIYNVPFLSDAEIVATIQNNSNFPRTTSVKWQRNNKDINITEDRYLGSTEDVFAPTLVINQVDFDFVHESSYRCIASNAEGSWTSSYTYVYVFGNQTFLENCSHNEECIPGRNLICKDRKCLCSTSYYHKNFTCYSRSLLRPNIQHFNKTTCNVFLNWYHSSGLVDAPLINNYLVIRRVFRNNRWIWEETMSVGNETQYRTNCTLQPGRLYAFQIQPNVSLTEPDEIIYGYSSDGIHIVTTPVLPGEIDRKISNFSSTNLRLKWEPSGQNTFLNHYRVEIEGHQQQTFGNVSQIYWTKKLSPGAVYNVSIIAVSYGYESTGPWSGYLAESEPYRDWIEIDKAEEGISYSHIPYGDGDESFRGDDVTSATLKTPIKISAGDGKEGAFDYVKIGSNGVIGLGEEFNGRIIHDINATELTKRRILCPFWTDLLTGDTEGNIFYQTYERGANAENDFFLGKSNAIVRHQFRDFPEFETSWLLKVTWENMTLSGYQSKTVTFQCLLITDGQSTFTVFNYIDVDLKPIRNKKITIGFQYKDSFEKNSFSQKNVAFKMSNVPGNRGVKKFWIYKMTKGVPLNKDEKECYDWYIRNKELDTRHQLSQVMDMIRCPGNNILLRFDPRYTISRLDRINRVLCYASMVAGRNAECCYRFLGSINVLGALERSMPYSGTFLKYNPFFERREYIMEDLRPKEACCMKSKHCEWYYEVRPIPSFYLRSPFNQLPTKSRPYTPAKF